MVVTGFNSTWSVEPEKYWLLRILDDVGPLLYKWKRVGILHELMYDFERI